MEKGKNNRNAAAAAFYDKHYDKSLKMAIGLTKNLPEAEDLVMHCFLSWMEKGKKFSDANKGHFFASIKNRFIDGVRRKKKYDDIVNTQF